MFMQTCMYVGCNTFACLPDILVKQTAMDEVTVEATVCGAARVFREYLNRWLQIEEYRTTRKPEWHAASDEVNDWWELLCVLGGREPLQRVLERLSAFVPQHPVDFMREQNWHEPYGKDTKVLMLNRDFYYFRLPGYCVGTTKSVIGSVAAYSPKEQEMIEDAFVAMQNAALKSFETKTAAEWGLSWVPVSLLNTGASEAFRTEESYLLADIGVFPPADLAKWVWSEWVKLYGDTFEKDRARIDKERSLSQMNLS